MNLAADKGSLSVSFFGYCRKMMVKIFIYFDRFIDVSSLIADRCRTRLIANFTNKIFHQLPSFPNIILMLFKLILYMLFF